MVEDHRFTDNFSWLLSYVRNLPETYNLRNIPIIWRNLQMYNDWGDFVAPATLLLLRTNTQHALHRASFSKASRWREHGHPHFLLSCKKRSCLFRTLVSTRLTHAATPAKAHSPQTTHSPRHPPFLILGYYYRNWIELDFAFAATGDYQGSLCNNLQTVAWEKWDIEKTHFTLWPLYVVTGSVWLGWLPRACGGKKERQTDGGGGS